jgi:hypothetical protein
MQACPPQAGTRIMFRRKGRHRPSRAAQHHDSWQRKAEREARRRAERAQGLDIHPALMYEESETAPPAWLNDLDRSLMPHLENEER